MEINLLPDIILKRRHEAVIKRYATLGLIAWAAMLMLITVSAFAYRYFQDQSLNSSNQAYSQLNASVHSKENDAFRADALEVQTSLKSLDTLFSNQEKMSVVLEAVSSVLPRTATIKSVNIAADKTVALNVSSPNYQEAAKVVAAFKDSQKNAAAGDVYFTNIEFPGAALGDKSVTFSLNVKYVYPTGGSDALTK